MYMSSTMPDLVMLCPIETGICPTLLCHTNCIQRLSNKYTMLVGFLHAITMYIGKILIKLEANCGFQFL